MINLFDISENKSGSKKFAMNEHYNILIISIQSLMNIY